MVSASVLAADATASAALPAASATFMAARMTPVSALSLAALAWAMSNTRSAQYRCTTRALSYAV